MEEREKPRSWTVAVAIVAVLVLLLVLYVLSTGPALWLENHDYLPVGVVSTFYSPVSTACEFSETLNNALVWYWKFWT